MAYETTDQLVNLASHHWYKEHTGNFYKLLNVFNKDLEHLSDSGEKVMKWRAIQDAEGTTLDLFGKDIKTYRPTKEDPPYRFLIYLKTLLARAQGTIPSIYKITSTAIGTKDGIKITKTKIPRHVTISLPWDYISNWPIEKFLLDNLQYMLAMGYWIDEIIFVASSTATEYIGVASSDRWESKDEMSALWWTGWKARTQSKPLYIGTATQSQETSSFHHVASWWSGWTAKSPVIAQTAIRDNVLQHDTEHMKTVWWNAKPLEFSTQLTVAASLTIEDTEILN